MLRRVVRVSPTWCPPCTGSGRPTDSFPSSHGNDISANGFALFGAKQLSAKRHCASLTPHTEEFYANTSRSAGGYGEVQPVDMKTKLLPFQRQGVAWMHHREKTAGGGLMTDHLGLGKTVQMIGLCVHSDREYQNQRAEKMKQLKSGKSALAASNTTTTPSATSSSSPDLDSSSTAPSSSAASASTTSAAADAGAVNDGEALQASADPASASIATDDQTTTSVKGKGKGKGKGKKGKAAAAAANARAAAVDRTNEVTELVDETPAPPPRRLTQAEIELEAAAVQAHRVVTVILQLQRVPVVGSCSKLTQPGEDLHKLLLAAEELTRAAAQFEHDFLQPANDANQNGETSTNGGTAAKGKQTKKGGNDGNDTTIAGNASVSAAGAAALSCLSSLKSAVASHHAESVARGRLDATTAMVDDLFQPTITLSESASTGLREIDGGAVNEAVIDGGCGGVVGESSLQISAKQIQDGVAELQTKLAPWLKFCGRYFPSYERRAVAFLADATARNMDDIDTPELRTLVVLPTALLTQWKEEIERHVHPNRNLTAFIYHGGNKKVSLTELESYDFVLTSYGMLSFHILKHLKSGKKGRTSVRYKKTTTNSGGSAIDDDSESNFDRENAGPLYNIQWKRVILDEAHVIRNSSTARWKAVARLHSRRKWCITATPLHNSIDDLQNLLTFVGLPRLPVTNQKSDQILRDAVFQRSVARALRPAIIRRTPVMKLPDGTEQVLVSLPPKTDIVTHVQLRPAEAATYNALLADTRSTLSSDLSRSFHMLVMMMRLRQTCCHPWLAQGKSIQVFKCNICQQEAIQPVTSDCGHAFCSECLFAKFQDETGQGDDSASAGLTSQTASRVKVRVMCPTCDTMIPFSVFQNRHIGLQDRLKELMKRPWESSAKLDALLVEIHAMLEKTDDDKMVVFSHFTSFLDVISVALHRLGIEYLRLDGSMPVPERTAVIKTFNSSASTRVMLASKTAVGVGLNLTAANHVVLVDPWWNPAIEEQAVHRCHRIGQKKPVRVVRLVTQHSIEQYCYNVSQRKKDFGDAVLAAATSSDSAVQGKATTRLAQIVTSLAPVPGGNANANANANDVGAEERRNTTNVNIVSV